MIAYQQSKMLLLPAILKFIIAYSYITLLKVSDEVLLSFNMNINYSREDTGPFYHVCYYLYTLYSTKYMP